MTPKWWPQPVARREFLGAGGLVLGGLGGAVEAAPALLVYYCHKSLVLRELREPSCRKSCSALELETAKANLPQPLIVLTLPYALA